MINQPIPASPTSPQSSQSQQFQQHQQQHQQQQQFQQQSQQQQQQFQQSQQQLLDQANFTISGLTQTLKDSNTQHQQQIQQLQHNLTNEQNKYQLVDFGSLAKTSDLSPLLDEIDNNINSTSKIAVASFVISYVSRILADSKGSKITDEKVDELLNIENGFQLINPILEKNGAKIPDFYLKMGNLVKSLVYPEEDFDWRDFDVSEYNILREFAQLYRKLGSSKYSAYVNQADPATGIINVPRTTVSGQPMNDQNGKSIPNQIQLDKIDTDEIKQTIEPFFTNYFLLWRPFLGINADAFSNVLNHTTNSGAQSPDFNILKSYITFMSTCAELCASATIRGGEMFGLLMAMSTATNINITPPTTTPGVYTITIT